MELQGREISSRLAKVRKGYKHPTAIGDRVEGAVLELFKEYLSPRFGIAKGKIFDSAGRISAEFDAILYEEGEVALRTEAQGRLFVPIEAVYGVLEIKARLEAKHMEKFKEDVAALDPMLRYYKPEPNELMSPLNQQVKEAVARGVAPNQKAPGVPPILAAVVTCEAPKAKTLAKYLGQHAFGGLLYVCVSGRELVTRWTNPPGFKGIPLGDASLPLLMMHMNAFLFGMDRRKVWSIDAKRYVDFMNNELLGSGKQTWSVHGDELSWSPKDASRAEPERERHSRPPQRST